MSGPEEAAKLLRAGVLEGVLVLLAGSDPDPGFDSSSGSDPSSDSGSSSGSSFDSSSSAGSGSSSSSDSGSGSSSGSSSDSDFSSSSSAGSGADVERRAGSTAVALAPAVGDTCGWLGARVLAWRPGEPVPAEVNVLVFDGAASFQAPDGAGSDADPMAEARAAPASPRAALRACLDGAWEASHAVANAVFIGARRPGRIVYLAPRSGSGEHADAARAGLENLARTLSIEWARHAITTVAIAPGASTRADELATLCAYLCSPAGSYFSGCLLDLRGP